MGQKLAGEPGKITAIARFIQEEEAAVRAHLLRYGLRVEDLGYKFSWRDLECSIGFGLAEKNSPLGSIEISRTFDDMDEVQYQTLDYIKKLVSMKTKKKGKIKETPRPKYVEEIRKERAREKTRVLPKMKAMTVEEFMMMSRIANKNLTLEPTGELKVNNEPTEGDPA